METDRLGSAIGTWTGGENNCCRLIIGMQQLPGEELRSAMSLLKKSESIDKQTVIKLKRKLAEEFKNQLTYGARTNEDDVGLRRLSEQI